MCLQKLTPPTGKPILTPAGKGRPGFQMYSGLKGPYYRFERPDAALYEGSEKSVLCLVRCPLFLTRTALRLSQHEYPLGLIRLILKRSSFSPSFQLSRNDKPGALEGVRYIQEVGHKGRHSTVKLFPNRSGKLLKVPFTAEFVFWK